MPTDPIVKQVSDPVIIDLHSRVGKLEESVREAQAADHLANLDLVVMKKDIEYIKLGQDKLNAGLTKLMWTVITAVVGVIVSFALGGGLISFPLNVQM